jgi:hypothetical protein
MKVFLAWHEYDNEGCDETKLLGVFSTRDRAEGAVAARRSKPGFVDFPDGFDVSEVAVDLDQEWMDGFVRMP